MTTEQIEAEYARWQLLRRQVPCIACNKLNLHKHTKRGRHYYVICPIKQEGCGKSKNVIVTMAAWNALNVSVVIVDAILIDVLEQRNC